jgi:hypothetical protein
MGYRVNSARSNSPGREEPARSELKNNLGNGRETTLHLLSVLMKAKNYHEAAKLSIRFSAPGFKIFSADLCVPLRLAVNLFVECDSPQRRRGTQRSAEKILKPGAENLIDNFAASW